MYKKSTSKYVKLNNLSGWTGLHKQSVPYQPPVKSDAFKLNLTFPFTNDRKDSFLKEYENTWLPKETLFNVTVHDGDGWYKLYLDSKRIGPTILGHPFKEGDRLAVDLDRAGEVIKIYIEKPDGKKVYLDYRQLCLTGKPVDPKSRFRIHPDFKLNVDPSKLNIDQEGLIDTSHDLIGCMAAWLLWEEVE